MTSGVRCREIVRVLKNQEKKNSPSPNDAMALIKLFLNLCYLRAFGHETSLSWIAFHLKYNFE